MRVRCKNVMVVVVVVVIVVVVVVCGYAKFVKGKANVAANFRGKGVTCKDSDKKGVS